MSTPTILIGLFAMAAHIAAILYVLWLFRHFEEGQREWSERNGGGHE